jgi:cadmium resistance protein CadD (predicted permease)
VAERSALHQFVIGVKHDAKLRNVYAGQIFGHVKFLLTAFFTFFFILTFYPNSLVSALFSSDYWALKKIDIF